MSSSKQTIQNYFDSLLSVDSTSSDVEPQEEEDLQKKTDESIQTSSYDKTMDKVNNASTATHQPVINTLEQPKSTASQDKRIDKAAIEHQTLDSAATHEAVSYHPRPKLKSNTDTTAYPSYAEPDTTALAEQKKQQLQKLLDQQSLESVAEKTQETNFRTQTSVTTQTSIATQTSTRVEITEQAATPAIEQKLEAPVVTQDDTVTTDVSSLNEHHVEVGVKVNSDDAAAWGANGRPHWAQDRFDALLFDVSGLTLAVPLVSLGQIVTITDELTPIFGQADWFMGILPTPLGKLRIVNTALFVMPEKYSDTFLDSAEYAVSLDGVPWALAVDKVNQPISLDPSEIRWRSERSKRPWLAGTVKSAMCALIDIPNMAQLLSLADRNIASK